jgi:hypothetical protein
MRQPGCKPGQKSDEVMTRIAEFDRILEQVTRERALRTVLRRWAEFDDVWDAAIRVCEHYGIGKSNSGSQPSNSQIPEQLMLVIPEIVSSSADSCVDTNIQ